MFGTVHRGAGYSGFSGMSHAITLVPTLCAMHYPQVASVMGAETLLLAGSYEAGSALSSYSRPL